MTDGVVIVNGPTDNGNGPLDFASFQMDGGYLAAAGSSAWLSRSARHRPNIRYW